MLVENPGKAASYRQVKETMNSKKRGLRDSEPAGLCRHPVFRPRSVGRLLVSANIWVLFLSTTYIGTF
jgi:hypothetical protein